MKTNLFLVTWT